MRRPERGRLTDLARFAPIGGPEPACRDLPAAIRTLLDVEVMVSSSADPGSVRVRPHVARAVERARHVILDFDGVMFNVSGALGRKAREEVAVACLAGLEYRPRPVPISFAFFGVHQTMAYLAEREPDHAVEVEAAVSALERDAALTAPLTPGLHQLLAACAATGRTVAVIGDLSESAVLAALEAHGIDRHIAGLAARQGLDLPAVETARAVERAVALLDADVTACLLVSGTYRVLAAARHLGVIGMGCECGLDRRKHLAAPDVPVVSGLLPLCRALLS